MSSSSLTLAKRHAGLCQGSLIKAVETSPAGAASPRSSYVVSSSAPVKVSEYCLLVGVRLTCYESWLSMDQGGHPTAIYSIVGASAVTNANDASFRVVTNQGTHLWLCPPSTNCRDIWLGALNAGLERYYSAGAEPPKTLKPVKPRYHAANMKNPPKYCNSCGKLECNELPLILNSTPLAQYGSENRMDMCPKCTVAQGLVEHVRWMEELYAAHYQDQQALCEARKAVLTKLQPDLPISDTEPTTHLELTPLSHHVLSGVLTGPECAAFCRISPTLNRLSKQFGGGLLGCMEFVEMIEHAIGIKDEEMVKLRQQAFRVNGDMGTALRLLAEHALPNPMADDEQDYNMSKNSTELLKSILEFLLDLLDEGEVQSVAFFWPQLLNIHLQMLPPMDVESLIRVELIEDFLLTVATKYSIQLAIELIWSHTADLDDSQTLTYCAKRKYAVLKFLCELESLLFDFEGGWGGGSVTVGAILGPSNHQIALLKKGMQAIQSYRMVQPERLSRSQRLSKYEREKKLRENAEEGDGVAPEELAKEALRVAKNADYLSTHLAFTKRMGDIAERLFHKPVSERKNVLQTELAKLNSSGTMGGDPFNRVRRGSYHNRIVRIPMNEGHVFRSKERTPVLLLVETLDEFEEEEGPKQTLDPFSPRKKVKDDDEEKKNPENDEGGKEDAAEDDKNESLEAEMAEKDENGDSQVDAGEKVESAVSLDETESASPVSADDDIPRTPQQVKKTLNGNMSRLGIDDGLLDESGSRHALKRFDSPKRQGLISPSPKASKESVEKLVTNVVAKQLNIPTLTESAEEISEMEAEGGTQEEAKKEADSGEVNEKPGEDNGEVTGTPDQPVKSKMTALGSGGESSFSKLGDTRREVLNSLMRKGMSGSHSVAAEAATAMQRSLQDLERRRAVELLLTGGDDKEEMGGDRQELLTLGIRSISTDRFSEGEAEEGSEDDEVMEAIRLLLIQYHVGQGSLSMKDAAKVLAPHHRFRKNDRRRNEGTIMHFGREFPEIDAGDIDARLIGCGTLPPAVLQALTLHKANIISNGELLELVKKDLEFVRNSESETIEAHKDKLNEDSAFWGRFAFGERWAEKRSRIAASSPDATKPGWDLIGMIVKANDDLRQEAFVMQLIELCQEAFDDAGLELWLLPYRILSTGRTTGIIEMVRNAMSFDALKKRPGYGKGGLREHLHRMTQHAADPGEAFKSAQRNFVRSLAAYSLLSYLFLFKDRHNGNILLDTAGHVIHIDFGFVFGIAPGGSFSLEISTPFKLTDEMLDVMDGMRSSLFSEFITLFCCGFLALQAHCDTFCTVVDITCKGSTFKCFEGRDSAEVVGKLRERFRPELGKEDSIAFCLDLIKGATQSYGTSQYDYFQYLSQGIAT